MSMAPVQVVQIQDSESTKQQIESHCRDMIELKEEVQELSDTIPLFKNQCLRYCIAVTSLVDMLQNHNPQQPDKFLSVIVEIHQNLINGIRIIFLMRQQAHDHPNLEDPGLDFEGAVWYGRPRGDSSPGGRSQGRLSRSRSSSGDNLASVMVNSKFSPGRSSRNSSRSPSVDNLISLVPTFQVSPSTLPRNSSRDNLPSLDPTSEDLESPPVWELDQPDGLSKRHSQSETNLAMLPAPRNKSSSDTDLSAKGMHRNISAGSLLEMARSKLGTPSKKGEPGADQRTQLREELEAAIQALDNSRAVLLQT